MNNKSRCVVVVDEKVNFQYSNAGNNNPSCRYKHGEYSSVEIARVDTTTNEKIDFPDPAGSTTTRVALSQRLDNDGYYDEDD